MKRIPIGQNSFKKKWGLRRLKLKLDIHFQKPSGFFLNSKWRIQDGDQFHNSLN